MDHVDPHGGGRGGGSYGSGGGGGSNSGGGGRDRIRTMSVFTLPFLYRL